MLKNIAFENQEIDIAQSYNGDAVNLNGANGFACVVEATVSTPTAKTFDGLEEIIDVEANTIIIEGHGLQVGLKGQLTSTDTLPDVECGHFAVVEEPRV